MNYFELFDIPIAFKIDKNILTQKYFELQKKYHPDFFTAANNEDQAKALLQSSHINKAYKIFKQEDETIKYVLQIKELLQEDEKYQLPPDFLMDVMELNENLSSHSGEAIHTFTNEIYTPIKSIIENYNDTTITKNELLQIKDFYFKKKYLQRILDRLID